MRCNAVVSPIHGLPSHDLRQFSGVKPTSGSGELPFLLPTVDGAIAPTVTRWSSLAETARLAGDRREVYAVFVEALWMSRGCIATDR